MAVIFPDLSALTADTLSLKLTRDPALVKQAQKLRHRVFFQEEAAQHGSGEGSKPIPGEKVAFTGEEVDEDKFDKVCDHLLVLDQPEGAAQPKVVGTYRLLRSNTELPFDHFYTETEFDISPILAAGGNLLELGRSCIAPEYRNGAVIQLLWRAIGAYIVHFKIDYMFGCASFHGTDPMEFQQGISYLHHHHLAPEHIRPHPQPAWRATLPILPESEIRRRDALRQLPPLMKGYMRLGGYIGEGVIVDNFCHTVDVCIVLDSKNIPTRYTEHFLDDAQRKEFLE